MIRKNTIVSMHYRMMNRQGQLLEDRQTTYLHGSPAISQRLQAQLEGLRAGDRMTVFLRAGEEDADDDFRFDVVIDAVREARPDELKAGRPQLPALPAVSVALQDPAVATPPMITSMAPMQLHLLSGFLGSGKTTAITHACRHLFKQGIGAAVVTNDLGSSLVDGALFGHLDIPSRQVINGCFCCNYNDLEGCIHSLVRNNRPAVMFAESVGSCTDLVATVLKPLLQRYPECRTTITVFADATLLPGMLSDQTAFDPEVRYIYLKQLEEAQVIVVSKIDLAGKHETLRQLLEERYRGKTILFQNSFDQGHLSHWLQTLDELSAGSASLSSLDIDYDAYASGEAMLAWLDQEVVIKSPASRAQEAALALMRRLGQMEYPIAHLKFLVDGQTKLSFTSSGCADSFHPRPAPATRLLINARIQTTPSVLSGLMADAILLTRSTLDCTIRTLSARSFQPGYPQPTHRVA